MPKIKIYIKSILVPLLLGGIIGLFISNFINYDILQKPFLSPPKIIFPIVWTILYILMGVSYGILKSNHKVTSEIKYIYYFQLIVNLIWPIIFFVLNLRLLSLFWIIFLLILVIEMIKKFYAQDNNAGLLQIPYLIWLVFATYLNLFIYILNA